MKKIERIQSRARQSWKQRHWLRNPFDIWNKSTRKFHAPGQSLIVIFLALRNFGRSLKCRGIGLNSQEELFLGSQPNQLRCHTTLCVPKNMSRPQIKRLKDKSYPQVHNQGFKLKKTLTFLVHQKLRQRFYPIVLELN